MEAIGLGVGVAGLAGLFSSCIECFELVQRGRYLGHEYTILETKFTNQRLRLLTWGWACGFADPERYDKRLEDEELRSCIEATLLHLITLLNNGKELKSKYGLKQEQAGHHVLAVASSALDTLIGRSLPGTTTNLGQKLHEFREKIARTQKSTKFTSAMRWAIEDKRKFTELVQHLKDLIDDLEGLTKWLDTAERQRTILQCEVHLISDVSVLESMEEARLGRIDAVSDAASLRLWELRDYQHLETERSNTTADIDQSSQASIRSMEADWDDMADDTHNAPRTPANAHYQVLHRVSCPYEATSIYLDPPSYSIWNGGYSQWLALDTEHPTHEPTAIHLCGQRTIPNLDAYLTQNSQLSFVAFRNYKCLHDCNRPEGSDCPKFDQTVYLSSKEVCSSLRELCQKVMDMLAFPEFRPGLELQAPYLWYYHSKDSLLVELKDIATQSWHRQSVQALLKFISDCMADEYTAVESLICSKMISWAYLPYLFVHGDLIIQTHERGKDYWQAHEMTDLPTVVYTDNGSAHLEVKVRSWAFDGNFRRMNSTLEIHRSYFGESAAPLPISSLSVLPFTYNEHCSREYFETRGYMYWSYRNAHYVSYNGPATDSEDFVAKRFMIDASTYHSLHPSNGDVSSRNHCPNDELDNAAMVSERPPDDNFLLLLPPTIHGYDMQEHQWRELLVSKTAPVEWNKKIFDRLILDAAKKTLLGTLLSAPITTGNVNSKNVSEIKGEVSTARCLPDTTVETIDIQKSDGQDDLIVHFHGAPGTGKSFAAEAVSELTERPLYRITCNDIGKDAGSVERRLDFALLIQSTWRCLVLLDDADVFIKNMRDLFSSDPVLEAWAFTFLRFFDRFHGTFIISSRCVPARPSALVSRIGITMEFPEQHLASCKLMLGGLISDLDRKNIVGDASEIAEKLSFLESKHCFLNGWAITHMFQEALKLAHSQGGKLELEHVEKVARKFLAFDLHLCAARGSIQHKLIGCKMLPSPYGSMNGVFKYEAL